MQELPEHMQEKLDDFARDYKPKMSLPGERILPLPKIDPDSLSKRTSMSIPVKPGKSTSEFAITAVTVVGGILVSLGVLAPEDTNAIVQAAGSVSAAVAAVGYAIARARVKFGR